MKTLQLTLGILLCSLGTQQNAHAQSSASSTSTTVTYQCSDGIDNDGDGAIDLLDFSCESSIDGSESDPVSQCQDGQDNDNDQLVDLDDPGCSSPQDNNEGDKTTQCQDGIDNDGDGRTDNDDAGCDGPTDDSEIKTNGPQCDNGIDDDGDGLIDMQDLGCENNTDRSERLDTVCDNGYDDDGDGAIDLLDPGCTTPSDDTERRTDGPLCDNGLDDDGDGFIDTSDDGCTSPSDNNEHGSQQCDDGIDNDNDGAIDYPADPECGSDQDTTENVNELASDSYNITVELKDSKDPIETKEALVYTIKVTNLETKRIVQSSIELNFDDDLEFISATNGGLKEENGVIRWRNIAINSRSTVELTATVQMNDDISRKRTLVATAIGHNSQDEEKTRLEPEKTPEVNINISSSTNFVTAGNTVSIQLKLNNDVQKAGTIDLRAFIDKNAKFVSAGNGGIEKNGVIKWNDLFITANGTLTIPLVLRLEDNNSYNTIKIEAYSGDTEEVFTLDRENLSNSSSSFSSSSSLSSLSSSSFGFGSLVDNNQFGQFQPYNGQNSAVTLEVLADREELQPGSMFHYNVTLHNPLNTPLDNFVLDHQFPSDSISIIDPANGIVSGSNIYWNNLSIPPRQSLTLQVQARANDALQHGAQFQSITTIRGGLLQSPIIQPHTLRIINQLPQTGGMFIRILPSQQLKTVRADKDKNKLILFSVLWGSGLLGALAIYRRRLKLL